MPLRDYQREILSTLMRRYRMGVRRSLVVQPTGTGKATVIAYLPKVFKELLQGNKRMLVLVHRKELVEDLAARIQRYNPELIVQIERAEYKASYAADVVVASIPTIGKLKTKAEPENKQDVLFDEFDFSDPLEDNWGDRIRRFEPSQFPVIVIDEAHHIHGETYVNVCKYFGVFKDDPRYNNPSKLLIGFTATPGRADNKGLNAFFDEIVSKRDLLWFIEQKYLSDVECFKINTKVELDTVKTTAGDFNIAELEKTVNTPERNELVVRKYIEHGAGLPALAFCVDIQHGVDLAAKFNEQGIQAVSLNYKTPTEERERIVADFKAGKIPVLCSATLLTEGFDATIATVALMARPTKSETLYRQMFGRVLRPHPSPEEIAYRQSQGMEIGYVKQFAIVLDFVDVSNRHSLTSVPSLFGLNTKFDTKGKRITEVMEEVKRVKEKNPELDLTDAKSMVDLQAISEKIDLFAKQTIPDELKNYSKLAWVQTGNKSYEIMLPDFVSYVVAKDYVLDTWEVLKSVKGIRTTVARENDLGKAIKMAEAELNPSQLTVARINAEWRVGEISDAQLRLLSTLYPEERKAFKDFKAFGDFMRQRYTKGDISTMISQRIQRRNPKVNAIIRRNRSAKKRPRR